MRARLSHIRLTISTRLALWYGLNLLLLLSLFVIFLYTSFHVSLHRDFEDQLRRDEARLREAVRIEAGTPVLQASEALRSVAYLTDGASGTYVRLLSPLGELHYQSPNFQGHASLASVLPDEVAPGDISRRWQGVPVRSRYAPLSDAQGQLAGWLEVTRLESALHDELHRLRWLLALGILLGAGVAIGSGYGLARRALRPVATLAGAARKIEVEDLGQRLPTHFGVRDELTDLAETLNALLARLDASFERERRFRADAAHEMFTPISAIQSEVDVTLRKPREARYYEHTLQTVSQHAQRLGSLVKALLQLSHAEALQRSPASVTNLTDLTATLVERHASRARDRGLSIEQDLQPGVEAQIEPAHMTSVIENLLDNAIKYTQASGTISVAVGREGDEAVLRMHDTGGGFTADDKPHLFDRFYRASQRTVQQTRGSGLGLSITKAVVDAYGGRIEAYSEGLGCGSRFTVALPYSAARQALSACGEEATHPDE